MVFNFFGLKKKPVIEDVEAKVPTPVAKPAPMTFDEALAAQAAAEAAAKGQAAPEAVAPVAPAPEPAPAPVVAEPVFAVAAEPVADAAPVAVARAVVQAEPEAPAAVAVAPVVAVAAEAAPALPASDAAPAAEPEVLGQMDTMKATREDVIAAYKIFLGRVPESMEVVDPRVGVASAALLVDFLASKEFLDQGPKSQLVLAVAKKILDERKQAAAAEGAAPAEQGQPAV
ncbi:hypothetical protein B9Z35_06130 [Limnohabitans sp. Jir61]|uniref:hypothetical protein n=1 Tax=Limnohabitans sp. Jir61 TaxID=1826168 RepID=UPI000D368EB7|nr:hypothetical protein [Limnohabitans sp. Jir61]PUE33096.1 hypothetical protein B9Z35_06130 [Limnohabitans sp. Jir61]